MAPKIVIPPAQYLNVGSERHICRGTLQFMQKCTGRGKNSMSSHTLVTVLFFFSSRVHRMSRRSSASVCYRLNLTSLTAPPWHLVFSSRTISFIPKCDWQSTDTSTGMFAHYSTSLALKELTFLTHDIHWCCRQQLTTYFEIDLKKHCTDNQNDNIKYSAILWENMNRQHLLNQTSWVKFAKSV
jgi:hypothetical protein